MTFSFPVVRKDFLEYIYFGFTLEIIILPTIHTHLSSFLMAEKSDQPATYHRNRSSYKRLNLTLLKDGFKDKEFNPLNCSDNCMYHMT
jgi:hypothetical protein